MPARIDDKTRIQITRQWLSGDTRDEIAATNGLGNGTVSTIIKEWQSKLDNRDYEAIRPLALETKKRGFEFKDVAVITRLYALVKKNSIRSAEIEDYLHNIEHICIDEGVSPKEVILISRQILALSKTQNLAPEKMPEELNQKIIELNNIKAQIETFTKEKEKSDQARLDALKQKDVSEDAIAEYIKIRVALKEHGLSIQNVTALLTLLDNCQTLDNDPAKIIAKLSEIKVLESLKADYQHKIFTLRRTSKKLEDESRSAKILAEQRKQVLEEELKSLEGHRDIVKKQLDIGNRQLNHFLRLKEKGIRTEHLATLTEIISCFKGPSIDPAILIAELQRYLSLTTVIKQLEKTRKELEEKEETLSKEVENLEIRKNFYEKSLDELFGRATHSNMHDSHPIR